MKTQTNEESLPKTLSFWLATKFKKPVTMTIVKQLPPEVKHLLAANPDDMKFVRRTISKYLPKFLGSELASGNEIGKAYELFLTEIMKAIAEEQKASALENKKKQESLAGEFIQMQRIQAQLLCVNDSLKREQFMAWYSALSLEQRSYFHLVVGSVGDGALAAMVQESASDLEKIVACCTPEDKEGQTELISVMKDEVERSPELKVKVADYLKHLGSGKAVKFWRSAQDKLQGDAKQLSFLLGLPYEQVDCYLDLAGPGVSPQWSDMLPNWARKLL